MDPNAQESLPVHETSRQLPDNETSRQLPDNETSRQLPVHEQLLLLGEQMLDLYDQAAAEVILVGRSEGYFDGWPEADLVWPASRTPIGPIDLAGRRHQARLVRTIFDGVPARRAARLADAYAHLTRLTPELYRATRLYLRLEHEFERRRPGSESELHALYQGIYLEALKHESLIVPDEGEAAIERARLTRTPLSHAQAGAEALSTLAVADDPRLDVQYRIELDGQVNEAPLRDWLREVADRTIAAMVAGELLATRYNTYTNLAWFGTAVWKVILDAQLLLDQLGATAPGAQPLRELVRRGLAMLIEFFAAHREDPTRIRPQTYWYGHPYSYLTRDMADLAHSIVVEGNRLSDARGSTPAIGGEPLPPLTLPPFLAGERRGPFVEYPHVGRRAELGTAERLWRLARWVPPSLAHGRRKRALARAGGSERTRREQSWEANRAWADATLREFGIEVRVTIHPEFRAVAAELELGRKPRKLLFVPTHQSILDHPVMYRALNDPALLAALGTDRPLPCAMFARAGLAMAGVRIGSFSLTMFGVSAAEFDRLLEEVDGYVIADRTGDTRNAIQRFARVLADRPGVLYPALTTAAFDIQSPPLQHSLFAFLPPDVVMIPIALRGSHALWPKCPKGNLRLNPGLVEVVVAPPILGHTTLLPRRRSLRVQIETAALLQSIHITHLLNPDAAAAA